MPNTTSRASANAARTPRVEFGQSHAEVGHVDGAGCGVEQCQHGDEQRRGDQADHHVAHARADLVGTAPDRDQHVAGRQHHLECHEQVEQVGREEARRDTGGQHQVHGMEHHPVAFLTGLPDRVDHHGQQHQRRHDQHQPGQPVDDQGDAEWGRPSARTVHDEAVVVGGDQQRDADAQHGGEGDDADDALGVAPAARQDRQGGGDQRDRQRQWDECAHAGSASIVSRSDSNSGSSSGCSASAWSACRRSTMRSSTSSSTRSSPVSCQLR